MRPFGAGEDDPIGKPQAVETAKIRTRVFLKQVQRTSAFWNLIGIHFWGCAGHNIILIFLIDMAEHKGLSVGMGLGIYITLTVFSSLTRFAAPLVADRTGSKGAMGVCFALQTFPVLILLVAQAPWTFFIFAILFGIGLGGEMTVFPIINRQYYGGAPTGTAYGWQMLGSGFGMALGPLAGGFLRDATGGYTSSIMLSFAVSLIGVISIILLPATSRQQVPDWEKALPPEIRALG
jgi:MFS family permease